MSAIQAILSSTAGYIVCNSSCRASFLKASHYMSDGYAWFGAAYFIYDMWSMYKVYVQKLLDKGAAKASKMANGNGHLSSESLSSDTTGGDVNIEPVKTVSFLRFCIRHPVMIIHHVFLGSFGLLVIVVIIIIIIISMLF